MALVVRPLMRGDKGCDEFISEHHIHGFARDLLKSAGCDFAKRAIVVQWRVCNIHVIPNEHFENLYSLPSRLAVPIHDATQRIAIALKSAFGCTGTSTRQHNEPHGNQDVWHYHVHVFPRYEGDNLYGSPRQKVSPEERRAQASEIIAALSDNGA